MGLFDRSKQVTTTTNNLSTSETNVSSNVQDSGNVITSTSDSGNITDAFNTRIEGFNSVFSQPIAIQAGGASGGGSFDMNRFFDSANSVAESGTQGGRMTGQLTKFLPLLLVAVVVWVAYKYFRK